MKVEFKVQYNPCVYNALTRKIPVIVTAYMDGEEVDDFMALFDSNYLAEEFRDFARELLAEGFNFTDYLALKHEYAAY